ncbi:MAG: YaiI/YqxD family protein [Xanthomonadales bacterium]|nr:YaiI/YqxD family protein [Xanthomonadales bacterium]
MTETPEAAIWVDADGCPALIKDILFRAAQRTGVQLTLVANHPMRVPRADNIRFLPVDSGFDVADHEIVRRCQAGDLVISSDIPLADEVIAKGALALDSRGQMLTRENIKSRLNMRDFLDTMRASGVDTGGPKAMTAADRQAFANQLDRWLARTASTRRVPPAQSADPRA